MIVDTSVLMAIILDEPEGPGFIDVLIEAGASKMSAGTWIELAAVISRRPDHQDLFPLLYGIVERLRIATTPMTSTQAAIGHQAYREYGRGAQHRADLNFGDCFSYALAKELDEPLLFKGEDFIHTDVKQAIPR